MDRSFGEYLIEIWERKTSMLCFGMDPVIERMKIDKSRNLADEIYKYFSNIMHEIILKITAVKPNLGFYLQYGQEGIKALIDLVKEAKNNELPVILDGKFGDIGRTSKSYARFAFEIVGADAVTINPYMGIDAVKPFLEYNGKGVYILALTSNKSATDFQYKMLSDGKSLYSYVLEKIIDWNDLGKMSVGAVLGATHGEIVENIDVLSENDNFIPLLIPGVGAQGGSYKEIDDVLNQKRYKKGVVRINSSSAISYAHERFTGFSYTEAAFLAVEELLKK